MSGQPDPANQEKTGAPHGLRIVELAGIGPCPFAGMMLADHGAEVILVERPGSPSAYRDVLRRSRRSIVVDLKQPEGRDIVIALAAIFKTRTRTSGVLPLREPMPALPRSCPCVIRRNIPIILPGGHFPRDGLIQPSPAPRFSDSTCTQPFLPGKGCDTVALLREVDYSDHHIQFYKQGCRPERLMN